MKSVKLSFSPKQTVSKLLSQLPERARDIIERRYGLGKSQGKQTLEAIGQSYGITRERVRQVENFALVMIKKSDAFRKSDSIFKELERLVQDHGTVVHERNFLNEVSSDRGVQNCVHFLLVLGDAFHKLKEDDNFHHRWTIDRELAAKVEKALHNLYNSLSEDEIISETEMIVRLLKHVQETVKGVRDEELLKRWLMLSRGIKRNPLGDWGLAHASHIKMRGIRDYAFLILRKNGKPLHFAEVAAHIKKTFGKEAHVATTHNELIKDKRFVLVGRGLYALAEWGYAQGIVREIIQAVLKKHGSLPKERIIEEVKKERFVKDNTILVNLQNKKYFKRNTTGRYALV